MKSCRAPEEVRDVAKLFTLQKCFFHPQPDYYHGMTLVEEDGEKKLVCPVKYREEENVIVLEGTMKTMKVKEVISPLTSLIKEEEVLNRANEYVSRLKFFDPEKVKSLVEKAFNSAVEKLNIQPLQVDLQEVEPFSHPNTDEAMVAYVRVYDPGLDLEETFMRSFGLKYYKRGAVITIPVSSREERVKANNYKKLEEKFVELFLMWIPTIIDNFTCRTVEIAKEQARQRKLREIADRLKEKGIDIKRDSRFGRIYFDDENNSVFPLIQLSINLEGDFRIDSNRIKEKLSEDAYRELERRVVRFFEELVGFISREVISH